MSRIAVVTGANKGIGFSIVKILLKTQASDVVYLTSRNEELGQAALKDLQKEGLNAAYHQLDLDSEQSISHFADFIKEKHGGLDVLINNAGIAYKQASTAPFEEQAEVTSKTNYFGTVNVCKALVPLIRDGGRVVFVSSRGGHMAYSKSSSSIQDRFDNKELSLEELSDLINSFIAATKEKNHTDKGWPNSAYGVSKMGMSTLCRIMQRDYDEAHPGNDVIFSSCCPGYCDTDMSSHKGPRPADEGADVAIFLATLPPKSGAARGQFWAERELHPWKR